MKRLTPTISLLFVRQQIHVTCHRHCCHHPAKPGLVLTFLQPLCLMVSLEKDRLKLQSLVVCNRLVMTAQSMMQEEQFDFIFISINSFVQIDKRNYYAFEPETDLPFAT